MRIGWITGWATSADWFRALAESALPRAEHVVVVPTPDAVDRLRGAGTFDWIAGYSLGSHLLLAEAEEPAMARRVGLLAPIWGFPSEAGRGGRISRTQVRHLARWLRREPAAALADFYRRAGLDVTADEVPAADLDTLQWGLARLESDGLPPRLPEGWRAWCGADDPLIDAGRLRELVPALQLVAHAGHFPAPLLRAMAEEVA